MQRIAHELIKEIDVTILCGHRNEMEQTQAFIAGRSRLQWPNSKHNKTPSEAVDIAPYNTELKGVDWTDIASFERMCKKIEQIASAFNIKLKLGRDFSFKDYPHCELYKRKQK